MPEVVREVVVLNEHGLHVRPSGQIVTLANNYQCRLVLQSNNGEADARSALSLLTNNWGKGTRILIKGNGEDAEEAVTRLAELFETKFGLDS